LRPVRVIDSSRLIKPLHKRSVQGQQTPFHRLCELGGWLRATKWAQRIGGVEERQQLIIYGIPGVW
jgi:hypothetical protein